MTPVRLAFACASAGLAAGAACAQQLVAAQSEIAFTTRLTGAPVQGHFKRYDAQIAYDSKRPEAAKVALSIDLASASVGTAEVDAELPKPEWFDTRAFPRATFESSAVKAPAPRRLEVAGKLAIKGISRDLVVPVTLAQSGAGAGALTTATGAFAIKRLDFRVGDGDWKDTSMVADEVQVRFKLVLAGVAPL